MTHVSDLSSRSSRIIATHSAIAGLCPLIPLPFVDDMVIRRIHRRMCVALFEAHGLQLTPAGAKALTAAPSGWMRGAATSMALFPLRKVMRKIVYLLAIKDCSEVASAVFHDGWLLAQLLEHPPAGRKAGQALDNPKYLKKVRKAMLGTYVDVDPAPLRRALVGAFLGARVGAEHAAGAVQRLLRSRGEAGEAGVADPGAAQGVEPLVSRMRDAAMGQWKYLDALSRSFHRHLGRRAAPEEPARDAAQA